MFAGQVRRARGRDGPTPLAAMLTRGSDIPARTRYSPRAVSDLGAVSTGLRVVSTVRTAVMPGPRYALARGLIGPAVRLSLRHRHGDGQEDLKISSNADEISRRPASAGTGRRRPAAPSASRATRTAIPCPAPASRQPRHRASDWLDQDH